MQSLKEWQERIARTAKLSREALQNFGYAEQCRILGKFRNRVYYLILAEKNFKELSGIKELPRIERLTALEKLSSCYNGLISSALLYPQKKENLNPEIKTVMTDNTLGKMLSAIDYTALKAETDVKISSIKTELETEKKELEKWEKSGAYISDADEILMPYKLEYYRLLYDEVYIGGDSVDFSGEKLEGLKRICVKGKKNVSVPYFWDWMKEKHNKTLEDYVSTDFEYWLGKKND